MNSRQTERGTYQYEVEPGRWVSRQRLHQLREPEREKARVLVTAALDKGTLKREPCATCGRWATEAHHDDYSKPLTVRWLCPTHHREADRALRPTPLPTHPVVEITTREYSAAAVALGRMGGKVTSAVKAKAARENGKKGGRKAKPT